MPFKNTWNVNKYLPATSIKGLLWLSFVFMKFFTALLFLLATTYASAQIVTDRTFYDFGEVHADDEKYVDFKLTNITDHNISVLKHQLPYGVSVRYSQKLIEADQSILVRIKYTPKRKGEFKADVPIYVSSNNEPIVLTVQGRAVTVNIDESLDVPDFTQVTEKKAAETFMLNIKVVRKEDGSPVENAVLDVIWDGVMYKHAKTDEKGTISDDFASDKYYVVAKAEHLGRFESELSIHQKMNDLLIELGPEGTISQVTEDSADTYEIEIVEAGEDTTGIPVMTEIPQENDAFPDNEYSANNIVFLIDVSVSMKQKGKMNLLKSSMIELTNLLRSIDKVAIVTYSSNAQLALKSTSAANKSEIIDVIQSLEARGSTSGQKGLKKAYQVLQANEIKGGNNQVFISTDGAFNLERQDKGMVNIVRKQARKGYKISVLGIKNEKYTVKNMKRIAAEGHGNYIHIRNYDDARKSLIEEVKLQSRAR